MSFAERLLDAVVPGLVAQRLPGGLTQRDVENFIDRNRPSLLSLINQHFGPAISALGLSREPSRPAAVASELDEAELWTSGKRTAANLAALRLLADKDGARLTVADRTVLRRYSGWGGLSLDAAMSQFPPELPAPEQRGLIHEYYTPMRVAREVARVVTPLLPELAGADGELRALEPSAGIGRFLHAFAGAPISWNVVEWSEISSRIVAALFPDANVFRGPFERWVRHGPALSGQLGLVASNPPYGIRGASVAEDPDRAYREKKAYIYFLRRALDLLAPNGLGVFLVPAGFLTGKSEEMRATRARVFARHHLAAAYRLPSFDPASRRGLFPGANLVTDLIFFRARGGELAKANAEDSRVIAGDYYHAYPRHILGREVGDDAQGEDDQTRKPRYHYAVEGAFTGLPELIERPICSECALISTRPSSRRGRAGVARSSTGAEAAIALPGELGLAASLGLRVDHYLALVATETPDEPQQLWPELHQALLDWTRSYGNPHAHADLRRAQRDGSAELLDRFLSAFDKRGVLIPGLAAPPPPAELRYRGQVNDLPAQAELLYRAARRLTLAELASFHHGLDGLGSQLNANAIELAVLEAGWCLDGPNQENLVPAEVYFTGDLWPKYDAIRVVAAHAQPGGKSSVTPRLEAIARQAQQLLATIAPAVYDDIDGVSPRAGWLPLSLVEGWVNDNHQSKGRYSPIRLVRNEGLVQPDNWEYANLDKDADGLAPDVLLILGWINHDRTLFSPSKKTVEGDIDDVDKRRLLKAAEWEASFRAWLSQDKGRIQGVENAYNRQFRGYKMPVHGAEALPIGRWKKQGPQLHPHQVGGARRVLANRGGLVAFDVGVGKTYTGIAILARARQEGWVKRPVILVPNSIIFKWAADIARVLPDYRVAVIGAKRKVISRGERKGFETSDTDTPAERAEKWTRFQAGEFDVMLVTYSALGRTRMNEDAIRVYAEQTEAIRREVALKKRNLDGKKNLSERDLAILKEGVAGWVAEQMELPESWEYDPGVSWDDIGVDMLIVDEAQNFKNLYLPEPREFGIPRFMGNAGDGAKRAWQLDFRCAAVRRRTGGGGVVLLSATPAKNSPLEFYNLIQYVDPNAWRRMGIRNPEQFIDRYLKLEVRSVITPKMDVVEKQAVTGFLNLHELRDVIFRYGEFKTAEDVGIKLPEPKVEMVEVDMDDLQNEKYDRYVKQIELALTNPGEAHKILGLLARMSLVSIHGRLDEGFDWRTAANIDDPSSPKFEALAERVAANRRCGHIVFVDNIAAHVWVRQTLINHGVPADRIAILNAEVAKASADRQRIAADFNGNPEEGIPPRYDIVIANAIAYEGIDLQTRTCAIHHLDLPWEPATLQQRNGRGVRQGNKLANIGIYYYFSRRSQDGLRFNLIQGKRNWMVQLIKSQDRETNNPGAQMDMGPEEILLLISRDPEKTRLRLESVKAQRQDEARRRVQAEAVRNLRSINTRFRHAERQRDPAEAARLRAEAEERLRQLATIDPDAWPYAHWIPAVRDRYVLVPRTSPVYEGLRIRLAAGGLRSDEAYGEIGRVVISDSDIGVGARAAGDAIWRLVPAESYDLAEIPPSSYDATFPATEEAETARAIRDAVAKGSFLSPWPALGWHLAPNVWVERWWTELGSEILAGLANQAHFLKIKQLIPVLVAGRLVVQDGYGDLRPGAVLPPTDEGWRRLLELAPASEHNWTELAAMTSWWWGRKLPRNAVATRNLDADDEAET